MNLNDYHVCCGCGVDICPGDPEAAFCDSGIAACWQCTQDVLIDGAEGEDGGA